MQAHRFSIALSLVLAVQTSFAAAQSTSSADAFGPSELAFFEKQVRPLLIERCYECHGPESDDAEGGLRLTTRAEILRGGDSGPAARAGEPDGSLLVSAVRYNDPLLQMPPDEKLPDREIELFEQWVRLGLPDPRKEGPGASRDPGGEPDALQNADWWSFQPVSDPAIPGGHAGAATATDAFVLADLSKAEMDPAPPADRRTLIRRATLDLTGLPPTPTEVQAFLADQSPNAFEKLVDRLLATPQYGERWGRHWLDVVRYADTSGCNGDFPLPEAYRYRNYVIASWNADKPFDQFIREQIAGDLLATEGDKSDAERHEQIVGTGYLAISRRFSSLAEEFHLTLDDTLDNLGKAILGLTVSCARCHDHKFDPIPQADYYALYGVFASTQYAFPGTEIYRHTRHLTPLVPATKLDNGLAKTLDEMDQLDEEIFATYTKMASLDTGAAKDALRKKWGGMKDRRDELLRQLPEFEQAFAVSEDRPVDVRLHIKGDPNNLGAEVPRGFLQILGGQRVPEGTSDSGRRRLADWLTSSENPLTGRVIVNRIWQNHFGKGIVRTPDDFGTRGAPPTHPELLDFLARRLMQGGWSLKNLHRELMHSRTYRMAAVHRGDYAKRDADNRKLWTFERRRLDAEAIRDSMLAVSGRLDYSPGGPHPFEPEWKWRYTQHVPFIGDFATRRRSVYLMQQRIRLQPYLAVFDGADTNAATGIRQVSTTPQQALFMLNSRFVHEQAAELARRIERETTASDRIRLAFELTLARRPTAAEVAEAESYIAAAAAGLPELEPAQRASAALASYLRALLSSNEFVFVE